MGIPFAAVGTAAVVFGILFLSGKADFISLSEKEKAQAKQMIVKTGILIIICGLIFIPAVFSEFYRENIFRKAVIIWFAAAAIVLIADRKKQGGKDQWKRMK